MFFLHLCLSNWPCQPAQQHHWAPPQPPSLPKLLLRSNLFRYLTWPYFDAHEKLQKIAKFWNAWAVRGNWCDSGKQKDQASEQTNKPKSKNALTECGLTPNIVHNNNHNVQEAAPERQQTFLFLSSLLQKLELVTSIRAKEGRGGQTNKTRGECGLHWH